MKFKESYFFCSQRLLRNVDEVHEIFSCIDSVKWTPEFEIEHNGSTFRHQTAYNKAFDVELTNNLLSLAVLIVPTNPKEFFPTRPSQREQYG